LGRAKQDPGKTMHRSLAQVTRRLLIGACLTSGIAASGQLVVYSFGTTGSPTTQASVVAPGLTAGVFSGNLGTPTTGGTSPLYTAGSGGSYFSASTWNTAAPGANYFAFTLTPDFGQELSVTSFTFAYRATSTGPIAFAVRSSADAYASDLVSGTITADSAWHGSGTMTFDLSGLDAATTFRIFGSGASSSLGTFRIDDITLDGSVTAVPEPSTYALILGAMMLAGSAIRRVRRWTSR
jgi:hypothetical protein